MAFAEILLEKVDKGDFIAGVVGQNIVLEGLAFSVFELVTTLNCALNGLRRSSNSMPQVILSPLLTASRTTMGSVATVVTRSGSKAES